MINDLKEKIEKVYVVENGDIILRHNLAFVEGVTTDLINKLKRMALDMVKNEEVAKATFSKESIASYYDENNEFLGHPGMHIYDKYVNHCDLIFVRKVSNTDKEEEFFRKGTELVKKLNRE